MSRSKKYSINIRDVVHGFITAFIGATLTGLIDMASTGQLPDLPHLKTHLVVGLAAGVSYLVKKFLQNSDSKFLSEPKNTLQ